MQSLITAACVAACLSVLCASPAGAHEGHDHGAPPPPTSATIAPRAEAASEAFELVAVVEGNQLAFYLDRFATNEPVQGAVIEVETPEGSKTAQPVGDAYRLDAPWLAKPGHYDLIVTVTAGDAVDVLPLTLHIAARDGTTVGAVASGQGRSFSLAFLLATGFGAFVVGALAMGGSGRRRSAAALLLVGLCLAAPAIAHEGEDHAAPATPHAAPATPAVTVTRDLPQRLGDGSVFMPKVTQRILAIRTQRATEGVVPRTVELSGRIIPDPNASGLVQASVGGRLSPPDGGFPRLGTRVSRGDVLAYVTPPLQAIDVSDMRQRQGELDQQIAIVERRVARFEPLATSGAVAKVQLEEARLELQGLKDRRAALDRVRREPEALLAPVDGVVAEGMVVAGQIAPSNMIVFHVVDPARLYVEALGFHALPGGSKATARTAEGRTLALAYRGSGFSDRNQSIPVHFSISGDTSGLRVGQFVLVLTKTDEEHKGIAVPRSSVVRATNGQDVVFEHVTAERFQPRPVRIAPLDGERVLIVAGIGAGTRIVTQGAELLGQVR